MPVSPIAWVRSIRARPEYVGLLRVLVDRADREGLVSVRLPELTYALDLTESPVKKMLAHLAALGFFKRESTPGPHGRQVLKLALDADTDELSAKIQDAPTRLDHTAPLGNHSHIATVYLDGNHSQLATVSDDDAPPVPTETIANQPRFIERHAADEPIGIHSQLATVSDGPENEMGRNHSQSATVSETPGARNRSHIAMVSENGSSGIHSQLATVSENHVSPTTPSEVRDTGDETINSLSSTLVDEETKTLKGLPSARAKAAKKKFDRGELKPIDADVIIKMVDRWGGPLGGADAVGEQIQLALAHEAVEKYTDIPAYVNNWLRRRAGEIVNSTVRGVRHVPPTRTAVPSTDREDLDQFLNGHVKA